MKHWVIVLCGVQPIDIWAKGLALLLEKCGYAATLQREGPSHIGSGCRWILRAGEKPCFAPIRLGEADCLIALEQLEGVRNLPFLKEGGTFFLGENRENPAAVSAGRVNYPVLEELPVKAQPLPASPQETWEQMLSACERMGD